MSRNQSAQALRSWRGLYKAALFETDESKLPLRIEEARRALIFRFRQLSATSPSYDGETEAIENGLYALHAVENRMKLNTRGRRLAPRASWSCAHTCLMER